MRRIKIKLCKNCDSCKCVYMRGHYRFFRCRLYYCAAREKMTARDETCEAWSAKKKRNIDLSAQRFDDAEKDVKILIDRLKGFE